MQKERETVMERGRERGELGMNFKYLWPNLRGIDQALPSQHPDFLTAELSWCISYIMMVRRLSNHHFKIAYLLIFSVAILPFSTITHVISYYNLYGMNR